MKTFFFSGPVGFSAAVSVSRDGRLRPPARAGRALALLVLMAGADRSGAIGRGGHLGHGHVDCVLAWNGSSWTLGYRHDAGGNPLDPNAPAQGPLLAAENTALLARDLAWPEGSRVLRPDGEEWRFTGAAEAGKPLWWFPQSAWAQGAYVGFSMTGPFAEYEETDPRLAGSPPARWGRVQAVDRRYRGKGEGHFSMWTNSTASGLKVWVESRDGFQAHDCFYVGGNGHGHPAMGFSSLGLYEIRYRGRAWLDEKRTEEVVSPVFSSYVAVGAYAGWIAGHFSGGDWFRPEQSGEGADPDGDGLSNLLEYACGLNPLRADAGGHPAAAGESAPDGPGLPRLFESGDGTRGVRFRRRVAADFPQIGYLWETASTPESGPWTPREPDLVEPLPEWPGWEGVTWYFPAEDSAGRQFGRLRVTLQEEPEYP